MIKILLTNTFMLLFTVQLIFAQMGSVTGRIVDADTKEPLIGTTVLIENTGKGSVTNLEGVYIISGIEPGSISVMVTYIGYKKYITKATVKANEKTELPDILLKSTSIGLSAVEVFASVIDERKTPVAVSTISGKDIDERFSGASMATISENTPGVYAIQGAGGYGDEEVYIRGFDQSNIAFMVNGIPVNDMENGRMFWSNFAGLSEVTRQMQVQRGLGASKLAISSIGGTVNMITKPSENSEGGRVEYQFGTGSWNERMSFGYNTGQSDNGWAASFQGSRTTTNPTLGGLSSLDQGGIVPGAFTDAWAYYLSVSKKINDRHQIAFWGFGAPVNRGSAFVTNETTREQFGLEDGERGNDALGVYNGDLYNARQNKVHKPLMSLSHYWDIDPNTTLSTSVYYSSARVYSTQPKDADNSTFFPLRDNASVGTRNVDPEQLFLSNNLIDYNYLSELNRSPDRLSQVAFPGGDINTPLSDPLYASRFYVESRHNDHDWIGVISNFKKQINNLSLIGGIDYRYYKGKHYAEVFDLLGGDYVLNASPFGDEQNKLAPNTQAKLGDKIVYDYEGIVSWASAFGQAEYSNDHFDVFASLSYTNSSTQRKGNFWHGRDRNNFYSLGESEKKRYNTYKIKAGVNYRYNNRLSGYVNAGYFTRPPFLRNSFADARYSNQYRDGLAVEKISSVEGGVSYRTGSLKVNLNLYYLEWKNRTTQNDQDEGIDEDNVQIAYTPFVYDGLKSVHKGAELDLVYNITSNLEINAFVSLGDWKWANNVSRTINNIEGNVVDTVSLANIKGLPVGTSAQETAGMGIHYTGLGSAYIGGRYNYANKIPIRYNPEDLVDRFITPEVILDPFPDYHVFSVYAGKYFDISDDVSGRLSVSVQNVFNTVYTRSASYFFNQVSRGFGYPRTFTIGLRIDF